MGSLPDSAEYWWDVKKRRGPYLGPDYRHHPTFTCNHYSTLTGNTKRTPYMEDITCRECRSAVAQGNMEGVLPGNAPEFYYLSKTQQKKERKRRAEQNSRQQHAENRKKQLAASGLLCSRCQSEMVKRTNGATGQQFLGCSKFPKCKYTKPI